jgi:class I fructose-bisphosphate aldolase
VEIYIAIYGEFAYKRPMRAKVREILTWYASEPPFVAHNLSQFLNAGALSGTGKFSFLSLDELPYKGVLTQLASNLKSLQPGYAFELAIQSKVSALVAPLRNIKACARDFSGELHLFAQIDLDNESGIKEAMQLGCLGVSVNFCNVHQLPQISRMYQVAIESGLLLRVHIESSSPWSFEALSQVMFELSQCGVHIVSMPLPETLFETQTAKDKFHQLCIHLKHVQDQVKLIRESAVYGEMLVSFYGLEEKSKDLNQVVSGGAMGYDFSSEYFQVTLDAAKSKITEIHKVYSGEEVNSKI